MLASPAHGKEFAVDANNLPPLMRFIGFMWNANVTPQQGVRFLGPLGGAPVRGFFRRRYRNNGFSADELDLYAAYTVSGLGLCTRRNPYFCSVW